jgi:hypothetical protein
MPTPADVILDTEPKQRPLVLDPIVIAYFGDFHKDLVTYLTAVCTVAKQPQTTS